MLKLNLILKTHTLKVKKTKGKKEKMQFVVEAYNHKGSLVASSASHTIKKAAYNITKKFVF